MLDRLSPPMKGVAHFVLTVALALKVSLDRFQERASWSPSDTGSSHLWSFSGQAIGVCRRQW